MNDPNNPSLQALPDGEAELRLTVRLHWEDIAALGQEAGLLAAQLHRPVSLDEAAGRRLRARAATHAKSAQGGAASSVASQNARTPSEQARQAIEKINGSAGTERDSSQSSA